MAVLKDLIVHGNSRFLNGARFNTINAESIGASEGIFNKLVATTLEAKEASIEDLTAQNATVVGLLDVQGQMQTSSWTNANMATIDGSFYICPTISSEATVTNSGTTQISNNKFLYNGSTITLTGTWATTNSIYVNETAANWTLYSKVMVTGEVLVNNEWNPIGTIRGVITGINTTNGTITIGSLSTNTTVREGIISSAPAILSVVSINSVYNARKLKISLYEYNSSGTSSGSTNLIGIMMTTAGTHGFTYLDIYNGANSKTSYTSSIDNTTTATEPVLRIGNLNGLPNTVSGSTAAATQPKGWGIYTTNGYFKGTIVASSGTIGGFTIDSNALKSSLAGLSGNGSSSTDVVFWAGDDDPTDATFRVFRNGSFQSGSENSYIVFDASNQILTVSGDVLFGNNKTLQETLSDMQASILVTTEDSIASTAETISNTIDPLLNNILIQSVEQAIIDNYEYTLTTDQTINIDKTYYVQDGTEWVAVLEPVTADIGTYYERSDKINPTQAVAAMLVDSYINTTPDGVPISANKIATDSGETVQDAINSKANIVYVYNLSEDSSVNSNKTYYQLVNDEYVVVTSPSGNPSTQSYYEREIFDVIAANNSKIDRVNGNSSILWHDGTLQIEAVTPDSKYATVIGGDGIEFVYGYEDLITWNSSRNEYEYKQNVVASINQDKLDINKTVVLDEMDVGRDDNGVLKWAWKYDPGDDSLLLKWIGG